MAKEPIVISWSGGKDSMLALHDLRASGEVEIIAGLTTVSQEYDRVCMHGVRKSLLRRQMEALRLPLEEIILPHNPSNADYETRLAETLERYKARGIRRVAFGDIFLEDLKAYRDKNLAAQGLSGIYPLWKQDTRGLVRRFLKLSYATLLVCVDTRKVPKAFAGRTLDESALAELPADVDPCGENGEFHSFVWKGPEFTAPLSITLGERVFRDPFMYCDVLEETAAPSPREIQIGESLVP